MRKVVFGLVASFLTFSLGLGIVVFGFLYPTSVQEVSAPEILPVQQEKDCIETKNFPGLSKQITEIKKGKSEYFPKRIWGDDMSPKHSVAGWYSKHLKAMDEKSLLESVETDKEIYRFLWLRTFHHPIFVRVERNQKEIKLFTKELDGAGGYKPGKLLKSNEIVLSQDDFCRFLNLLEEANYWQMPTENDALGFDGAQWILEAVKENRYHVVDRWTPNKSEFRNACVYLLKLSGIDVDKLKDDLY